MDDDLEEELLAVAGRSLPGTQKRNRKAAESSDDDYGIYFFSEIMFRNCY